MNATRNSDLCSLQFREFIMTCLSIIILSHIYFDPQKTLRLCYIPQCIYKSLEYDKEFWLGLNNCLDKQFFGQDRP